jgi:AraC-like DNA-binding protein
VKPFAAEWMRLGQNGHLRRLVTVNERRGRGTPSQMAERQSAAHAMHERLPIPALRDYVSCVWIKDVGRQAPHLHRTIPNGCAELVCVVGSIPKLVGPQTRPTDEPLAPGTVAVGVRFRPGAAPPLLAAPASELLDREIPADELWGAAAIRFAEDVAAAPSPDDALALVESVLVELSRRAAELDPLALELVRRLLVSPDDGVRSLASSLYISERQLRRRCEFVTGVGPKALQRMFRFQRFLALAHAEEAPARNLARLARDAGYADQSHLSRETARLADRTPRAVLHECRCAHDHTTSHRLFLASALSYARSRAAAA